MAPRIPFFLLLLTLSFVAEVGIVTIQAAGKQHIPNLSPTALAATGDGKAIFVACATANQVLRLDLDMRRVTSSFPMPGAPSGLAISPNGSTLYVTCASPESKVCVVDLFKARIVRQFEAGHTAMAPVLSPDGRTLFVCSRFNNEVRVIDLDGKRLPRRIPVEREPVAEAITPDGRWLFVANLLPAGRADADNVAAAVSVIDAAEARVVKQIRLPNGGGSLNDIRVSPDGRYCAVTHSLSRFFLPADQVERGWMNASALTIIDVAKLEMLNTVLLDDLDRGAANPWGVAWSPDGANLVVTHAGTHEVSVIRFPALVEKLLKLPASLERPIAGEYGRGARIRADVPNDLTFMSGIRTRLKLSEADRGPRAIVMAGSTAYVANYFSDTVSRFDLRTAVVNAEPIPIGPKPQMSTARKGELYFHDATLCLQGWQSCSSCHPGGGRVDGLNWDLMNDGVGNPKNTKSLLWAHKTPPAMSLGVRGTADDAVRAGLEHILFSRQPEAVAAAIDEYLRSLQPVPSPFLAHGRLCPAARRGKLVFQKAGCAACHPPGLFTDLHQYDVGTRASFDGADDRFDTPTLVELWRTAPYLHDGSAATLRDVLTTPNPYDQHGKTSGLTGQETEDLVAYLLSL